MQRPSLLSCCTGLLLLLPLFLLVSCAGTSPPSPSPVRMTPTVALVLTVTVTSKLEGILPTIECDQAVQLIEQNTIQEVQIYYDKSFPTQVVSIYLTVRASNQKSAHPIPTGPDNELSIDSLTLRTCPPQLQMTVKQINKGLPKAMQHYSGTFPKAWFPIAHPNSKPASKQLRQMRL